MGTCIAHEPCPKCSSRDNLARYEDGSGYCFGCGHHENKDGVVIEKKAKAKSNKDVSFVQGECKAIVSRHISYETCDKWKYLIGEYNGNPCHIAQYFDKEGELVGQQLRFQDKSFVTLGKADDLYGKHLWTGGKYIVITEGQLDALSLSEVQKNKYPVVSVPSGIKSAAKAIKKNLAWLEENFEYVVLMFDSDEPGRQGVAEVAQLFSPGKCRVAVIDEKDASEMLVKGKADDLVKAVLWSKPYRPEAIIPGEELWDTVREKNSNYDVLYPYRILNTPLLGLRKGEIVTLCAGTGTGKSTICREIAYHILKSGGVVGYIALEESIQRSALGIMSVEANRRLHLEKDKLTEAEFREAFEKTVGCGRYFSYDHWGSIDPDTLIPQIRFMVRGFGVEWIVLDHISIVVSGLEEGDERRLLDNTMTKLRKLVEELKVGLILVSHLRRPEGNKGHENGQVTSLAQLRGSASIGQVSDIVIGLERDQQSEVDSNTITVRVLKNRFSGEQGIAGKLVFNKETGRLLDENVAMFQSTGGY
jgi:twinkle protein